MVQFCFNYMYVKSGGSLVTLGKTLFLPRTLVPSLWDTDTLWSIGSSGCWSLYATKGRTIAVFFLLYPQVLAQVLVQSRCSVNNSEIREIKQYLRPPFSVCILTSPPGEKKQEKNSEKNRKL